MTASKILSAELLDSLMSDYKSPEDLIGEHGCESACNTDPLSPVIGTEN